MTFKAKKAGVRFQLGPLEKNTPYDHTTLMKDSALSLQDAERDSGAPSPDTTMSMQPASIRLIHTENRMSILSSINDILKGRSELEGSRTSLMRLHEDLRVRLRATTRDNHARKLTRLEQARNTARQLSAERMQLETQISRLTEHLAQHEREHAAHSRGADDDLSPIAPSLHPTKMDKKPSRKADQKLAAGRLLREVLQLRSRLALLERRLQAETRRKKVAEDELSVLRAALTRNKGRRIALKRLIVN